LYVQNQEENMRHIGDSPQCVSLQASKKEKSKKEQPPKGLSFFQLTINFIRVKNY